MKKTLIAALLALAFATGAQAAQNDNIANAVLPALVTPTVALKGTNDSFATVIAGRAADTVKNYKSDNSGIVAGVANIGSNTLSFGIVNSTTRTATASASGVTYAFVAHAQKDVGYNGLTSSFTTAIGKTINSGAADSTDIALNAGVGKMYTVKNFIAVPDARVDLYSVSGGMNNQQRAIVSGGVNAYWLMSNPNTGVSAGMRVGYDLKTQQPVVSDSFGVAHQANSGVVFSLSYEGKSRGGNFTNHGIFANLTVKL